MELMQWVKWTKPGEKKLFLDLAKQHKDDANLKHAVMDALEIDSITALFLIKRFEKEINQIRNQKQEQKNEK